MKTSSLTPARFHLALAISIFVLACTEAASGASPKLPAEKTRLAIVGLDHDHVWGIIKDLAGEPDAELVAIAETNAPLIERAQKQVGPNVRFYSDYKKMLDEAKPDAVFATTENDKHLEILRECAKRHIHYSTEKPMATSAADAREMERLANQAGIKLMVNYWNAWVAPTHELYRRVRAGEVGPIQRIIVQYGHAGPKEIGVSKYFADWLYDPVKNGGGAIMDFGCYGAELSLWLKGRPTHVSAVTQKLKVEQNNPVDDDATITLDYPDATAVIEASWDWPYGMDRIQVFGPKGSLLATRADLFFRPAKGYDVKGPLEGGKLALDPADHSMSNPVAYFVDRIRNDKPVEDPLSARLNVQVLEILDAARESARARRAQELH